MSYLIDTNIISEVRKGDRCDGHVAAWYASIADQDLYLSTLVLGEIRKGIELARLTVLAHVLVGEPDSTSPGHALRTRTKPRRSNDGCGRWRPHSAAACSASTMRSPTTGDA